MFLNGCLVGLIQDPLSIVNTIRKLRRQGLIDPFISVSLQESIRSVLVASDGGRLCRPYVVVDRHGTSMLKTEHIDEVKSRKRDFDSLVKEGVLEFLDVNELNNSNVAVYDREIVPGVTSHMEVCYSYYQQSYC